MRWLGCLVVVGACGGSGLSVDPYGGTPAGAPAGSSTGHGDGTPAGVGTGVGGGLTPGIPSGTTPGSTAGTTTGLSTGTLTGTTPAAWSHTATVDGDPSEYGADETFPVDNGTVWITWDADALYVAVQHPDVTSGGPLHWLLIYLGDGVTGTTAGVPFASQTPSLAVPVSTLVRWKADGSWNSRETWTGVAWQSSPYWIGTGGSSLVEDPVAGVVELRLPDAALGLGDTVAVHVSWVYEGAGYESSYAPSPGTSFTSGAFDPDYTRLWVFDRTAATAPADYVPQP